MMIDAPEEWKMTDCLNPTIVEGYVRLLYPDKPNHPRQKYLLTVKGLALYNALVSQQTS